MIPVCVHKPLDFCKKKAAWFLSFIRSRDLNFLCSLTLILDIFHFLQSLLQSLETSDGTQHKQHKQMNILQTITSTGSALQVVRAQTIQTSHSSASSRRAITSTTYSSHYTNGGTTANNPPSNGSGGDLLVRLINKLM